MEIVDTHCHLDVSAFDNDRDEIIAHCASLGVTKIIVPGIQAQGWKKQKAICDNSPGIFSAFGLHPLFMDDHKQSHVGLLAEFLQQTDAVAVGEIGLDFYHPNSDRKAQQRLFEAQLEIAHELDLPVILHVRKAHDQTLSIIRRFSLRGGTCHAFNGSHQQAIQYIELGFKLGFGGTMTFPGAHKIHNLASSLPIESIVLETDAPDMSGVGHQGERNSPEYLPDVLQALATLRKMDIALVAEQTTANAANLFALSTHA